MRDPSGLGVVLGSIGEMLSSCAGMPLMLGLFSCEGEELACHRSPGQPWPRPGSHPVDEVGRPQQPAGAGLDTWEVVEVERYGKLVGYIVLAAAQHLPACLALLEGCARLCGMVMERAFELDDLSAAVGRLFEEQVFIYEITTELTQAANEVEFCQRLVPRVAAVMAAERAFVALRDAGGGSYRVVASKGLEDLSPGHCEALQGVVGEVLDDGQSRLIEDVGAESAERFSIYERKAGASLLVAPIRAPEDAAVRGALAVMDGGRLGRFTSVEERLLQFIAEYVAAILAGMRMVELAKEMQIARRIVEGLLPESAPELRGLRFAGRLIPACEIGGDYFDYIPMGADSVAVVVADVSGHTLPAALMMAVSRSGLRWSIRPGRGADQVLREVASNLHGDLSAAGFFMSLCLLIVESEGRVRFASAGHPPALLIRSGGAQIVELGATGMVAGVVSEVDFGERSFRLEEGDCIVLYTDGISEAGSAFPQEQFGLERLKEAVREVALQPAEEIVEHILRSVENFAGQAPSDDVTVVVVQACAVSPGDPCERSEPGSIGASER